MGRPFQAGKMATSDVSGCTSFFALFRLHDGNIVLAFESPMHAFSPRTKIAFNCSEEWQRLLKSKEARFEVLENIANKQHPIDIDIGNRVALNN